jgi:hypothetical protein
MPVKIARSTPRPSFGLPEAAGSQPHLASGFQGRCKIATIHADFGVIRGMSVKLTFHLDHSAGADQVNECNPKKLAYS